MLATWPRDISPPQHNESGLLTTDLAAQQGWDSTIGQEGVTGGVWTNFVGGQQGVDSKNGTPAEYFNTVLGDLETIWPGCEAAFTGTAERMHWPTFEWAQGSYTCYRPGQWAFWSLEGQREGNVHFCGEHCSLDFQGWMEGAAETGGLAAAEVLESLGISATLRAHPYLSLSLKVSGSIVTTWPTTFRSAPSPA